MSMTAGFGITMSLAQNRSPIGIVHLSTSTLLAPQVERLQRLRINLLRSLAQMTGYVAAVICISMHSKGMVPTMSLAPLRLQRILTIVVKVARTVA